MKFIWLSGLGCLAVVASSAATPTSASPFRLGLGEVSGAGTVQVQYYDDDAGRRDRRRGPSYEGERGPYRDYDRDEYRDRSDRDRNRADELPRDDDDDDDDE